jgi:hypothetical protein
MVLRSKELSAASLFTLLPAKRPLRRDPPRLGCAQGTALQTAKPLAIAPTALPHPPKPCRASQAPSHAARRVVATSNTPARPEKHTNFVGLVHRLPARQAAPSRFDMTAPISWGVGGRGLRLGPGLSATRGPVQFYSSPRRQINLSKVSGRARWFRLFLV